MPVVVVGRCENTPWSQLAGPKRGIGEEGSLCGLDGGYDVALCMGVWLCTWRGTFPRTLITEVLRVGKLVRAIGPIDCSRSHEDHPTCPEPPQVKAGIRK